MDSLALLANTKLLPVVNAAIASNQNGWGNGFWIYSGGQCQAFTGKNIYDIPSATTDGRNLPANPQPAYKFDITKKNWQDEFNRIRGDAMELVFNSYTGGSNLYHSKNAIVSGAWCVGINDPVNYPLGANQGKLPILYTTDGFCPFGGVGFYCKDDSSDGLTLSTNFSYAAFTDSFGGTLTSPPGFTQVFNYSFSIDSGIVKTGMLLNCSIGYVSAVTAATVSATGVSVVSQNFASNTLAFQLSANVSASVLSATLQVTATTSYTGTYLPVPSISVTVPDVVVTGSTQASGNAISFGGNGVVTIAPQFGTLSKLNIIGTSTHYPSAVNCVLSNTTVKGVWVAYTLPVPGINFYLDQDLPQYLDSIDASHAYFDGGTRNRRFTSSMRIQTPLTYDENTGQAISSMKDVGLMDSAIFTRPTPWSVLRTTDNVPWNFGWNVGAHENKFSFSLNPGEVYYGEFTVPEDTDNVGIYLLQSGGDFSWNNGTLLARPPLPVNVKIYVGNNGVIDPTDPTTYSFVKTTNLVNIPNDGGANYIDTLRNSGVNYLIQNTSNSIVSGDSLEVIFYGGTAPTRDYFPTVPVFDDTGLVVTGKIAANEGFSYVVDGTPRFSVADRTPKKPYTKPIPPSGYCIFKIKASRMPVDNGSGIYTKPKTGAAITATIGQWKVQIDGSLQFVPLLNGSNPYTITIPANAADSGEVDVFWPVLSGNEVTYQCSTQINLEVWANWQPIFFSTLYGEGSLNLFGSNPVPTVFRYAMGFKNRFDPSISGYDALIRTDWLEVQYPICLTLYNDLVKLLYAI